MSDKHCTKNKVIVLLEEDFETTFFKKTMNFLRGIAYSITLSLWLGIVNGKYLLVEVDGSQGVFADVYIINLKQTGYSHIPFIMIILFIPTFTLCCRCRQ